MKNAIRTVLAAATVAASFAVLAQDGGAPARSAAEAQKAVDARIEHFKLIKKTYEPLTDMLKNKRDAVGELYGPCPCGSDKKLKFCCAARS